MPFIVRRLTHGTPDYDAAVALRRAVLRTPLGLDFTAEQLATEADDIHLALFDGMALVGTAILTPYGPATCKLRQMAVAGSHRGLHLGARLLAASEAAAREAGVLRITLAARVTAEGFYVRHGYAVEGGTFIEVTLPHVTMWKDLTLA